MTCLQDPRSFDIGISVTKLLAYSKQRNWFMVHAEDAGEILLELVKTLRIFRVAGTHQGERTIWGSQARVLQYLNHHDARLSELAQQISVSASVASRAVEALEADGLVERQADADDGRVSVISITEAGRVHVAELHRHIAEKFAQTLEDWTSQDIEHTIAVLQRLNTRLDQLTDVITRTGPTA